ncbi:60S ribosome biogenesis protein Mak11 [Ampelomyces quisqualis]|uniref:60S ribosome biogenesis protein Mak11 n=1 Tax=Ampelomyces quisqualis TaxID=50730 RepID=A0A6A5QXM1_AMPQU|nr:60S ribosome biogenesis protein Mak11 [Ampelomyces quisqualis]
MADKCGAARTLKSRKEEKAPAPKQAAAKSREGAINGTAVASQNKAPTTSTIAAGGSDAEDTTVQIITGSYERVLHGFAATIPRTLVTGQQDAAAETEGPEVDFTDTFLFNAHTSAIRCLALSPLSEETSKVMLATGATDERINLYSLSTAPPVKSSQPKLPSLHGASITENPKNKELGSLLHHSSNITALYFPTRSKLLSAAEDSTIAITRTRDWTALSTIKAPIPKPQGRPSGDTAGPGEVPSGVNDFAVHPSMKLMVSVGKGEKCMRLWNLVTGKKAGVLNFDRNILTAVGEGRFGSGEGRRVIWDKEGDEYAVAFERGVVVFSIDSVPKAKIVPTPRTKVHQIHYLSSESHPNTLLVSTEDGRVLLYDTSHTIASSGDADKPQKKDEIPSSRLIAQIGGPGAGISGRVKDFEILPLSLSSFLVITGSSDGTVRTWSLNSNELGGGEKPEEDKGFTAKQVGKLLGTYKTGTRVTCLKAFIMTGKPDAGEEEEVVDKDDVSSSDDESE